MKENRALTQSFVTGRLGFVGRHLAERLSQRGDDVVVSDIHAQPTGEVAGSYVQADVTNLDSLRAAFAGKDVVFHVASLVQTKQANAETVWAVNLGGTQNVIEVCRELGVKRLVYVSSASVVYEGRNIENGDETLPYASSSQAPYADSKIAAEKAVLEAHTPDGLRTCAIRPHVVFGPGDGRFLPALIERAQSGRLKYGVGRGRKISDFTYIDNLIDALVAAEEKLVGNGALGGQAFFVTNGEPMGFWDFVDKVLVEMNQPMTRGRIPYSIAYAAAMVAEGVDAILGKPAGPENGLTRFAIRYMCTHHYFSIDKARRELGYEPAVTIDEGIARTIEHLRSVGAIDTHA